ARSWMRARRTARALVLVLVAVRVRARAPVSAAVRVRVLVLVLVRVTVRVRVTTRRGRPNWYRGGSEPEVHVGWPVDDRCLSTPSIREAVATRRE
ncbi:MAG: hypothetical protein QOE15_3273, partial [Acidimicrobiaceae bacterium]|nr:hypothetical protein [Acidimicrobiaceae bacterium]